MSVNFYNPSCQETLNDYLFGLCDDQDGRKAYTNTDNPVGGQPRDAFSETQEGIRM